MYLRIHVSDRDAQLRAGFEDPQACDLHREVLLRSEFDQAIEGRIIERPPPLGLNGGLRDSRVMLFNPVVLNFGFWCLEIGTDRTAAHR